MLSQVLCWPAWWHRSGQCCNYSMESRWLTSSATFGAEVGWNPLFHGFFCPWLLSTLHESVLLHSVPQVHFVYLDSSFCAKKTFVATAGVSFASRPMQTTVYKYTQRHICFFELKATSRSADSGVYGFIYSCSREDHVSFWETQMYFNWVIFSAFGKTKCSG